MPRGALVRMEMEAVEGGAKGERKRNEDNKAETARTGWGRIRKMNLEITGQEDAASWEDGALGRVGTRLQGKRDHHGDSEP